MILSNYQLINNNKHTKEKEEKYKQQGQGRSSVPIAREVRQAESTDTGNRTMLCK